jgi:hypothetical protein
VRKRDEPIKYSLHVVQFGKFLYAVTFLFLLSVTYFYRIRYSLWFDEAAVVENAKNLTFSDLRKGLNWLQTIPIGYFVLTKFVLQFPLGVEILRLISMIAFVIGAAVATRKLLPTGATYIHKASFLFILLLNPVSITYATMVKPYAFEFLIGILGIYFFKEKNQKGLILLSFLAPLFSNTGIIILISIALVLFFKDRQIRKAIFMICAASLSSSMSLFFTASATRELMQLVWFGYVSGVGPESVKSAVGGIGRLPFSGLGIIPQSSTSVIYPYLSFILLIILLVFIRKARTDFIWVLFTALTLCFLGHALLIIPATGRLLLGISGLIWIITYIRIFDLGKKTSYLTFGTIFLFVSSSGLLSQSWLNSTGNSQVKETISVIDVQMYTGRIYSSLWAGPATRYYLGKSNSAFNPNTIWVDRDPKLEACQPVVLRRSDLIILDNIPASTLDRVKLLPYLKEITTIGNSGAFEVTQSTSIPGISSPKEHVSCMYYDSNPQFPIKDQ